MGTYTCIRPYRYEKDPRVGVVQLNRPEKLNALSLQLMEELITALEAYDADPDIRCMVLHGNERAFAAGADIDEMAGADSIEMLLRDQFRKWERISALKKPLIAAVSGYALGGGCELAMLCDIIVASETAQFGQPEINIGVMPGAGGTQRLTRTIGKAMAMELVLTGRFLSAHEAHRLGLVNRVVPVEVYLDEAFALASLIASKPPIAVRLAKEAVLKALNTPLDIGLEFERKNFYLLFSTADQKEGMRAFQEKRPPQWQGR
jgi:enoyl-CoA hydratase